MFARFFSLPLVGINANDGVRISQAWELFCDIFVLLSSVSFNKKYA